MRIKFLADNPYRPPPPSPLLVSAQGMNEYTHVYDFFLQQLSHFTHEWMFGLGEEGSPPLPPFKDFINSQPFNVSV